MHQFSNITGRLVGIQNMNTKFQVIPGNEPSRMVLATANQKVATMTPRYAGTAASQRGSGAAYPPLPESLRRSMEKFQIKDGVPVHLKGGAGDKLLFGATIGLCFLGVGMVLQMVYEMAVPKKKK